jgi:hypothetical protein
MSKRCNGLLLSALFAAASAAGCRDGAGPSEQVGAIQVNAPVMDLEVGSSVQLTATLISTSGVTMSGQGVTWSSSDQAVASVTPGGRVTGHAPGQVEIRARSGSATGTVPIWVRPSYCGPQTSRSLADGQSHAGTLGAGDCLFLHGAHAHGYALSLPSGGALRIDMTSNALDALIVVTTPQMDIVTWDDDGGSGTNARLMHRFQPGSYIVWATTFGYGETGAYVLSAQAVEIRECTSDVGSIEVGQTRSRVLGDDSCVLPNNRLADPWELTLSATTSLRIDLMSSEFDAFLVLEDANGSVIDMDDDSGAGFNSRIQRALDAGRYRILATTYAPGMRGSYELSVQVASASTSSASTDRAGSGEPAFGGVLERSKGSRRK